MAQNYIVPSIYSDMSDQNQGYFAFRFHCQHCSWQIETRPVRSKIATATNIMDVGMGLLNGFWGRAAEVGEKMYGSKWHTEQAEVLQTTWGEVKHHFHFCPKCQTTVCSRCFNTQVNLCIRCAPDLKADGASFQHGLNVDAQREQIQHQYQAPQFNVGAIPSAVTPNMLPPAQQPRLPQGAPGQAGVPSQASVAGYSTPGYPQSVACPSCAVMGPPGKFCSDCGTKLPFPDLFCPQCSASVLPTTRFCPECGTKLHSFN